MFLENFRFLSSVHNSFGLVSANLRTPFTKGEYPQGLRCQQGLRNVGWCGDGCVGELIDNQWFTESPCRKWGARTRGNLL